MPSLDVNAAITDPIWYQPFVVNRQSYTLDPITGRNIYTTTPINAFGVVTEGAFDPLARAPQYQVSKDTLKIVTPFKFFMVNAQTVGGVTTHYTPDVVLFGGSNYLCIKVWDYTSYGAGFTIGTFEIVDSEGTQ